MICGNEMTKEELLEKLKRHIIDDLHREELSPEAISAETSLFEEDGLGLDSLDAVELVMLLEKHYGAVIDTPEMAKSICANLSSLADFILQNRKVGA